MKDSVFVDSDQVRYGHSSEFRCKEGEGLYYLGSVNKVSAQLINAFVFAYMQKQVLS